MVFSLFQRYINMTNTKHWNYQSALLKFQEGLWSFLGTIRSTCLSTVWSKLGVYSCINPTCCGICWITTPVHLCWNPIVPMMFELVRLTYPYRSSSRFTCTKVTKVIRHQFVCTYFFLMNSPYFLGQIPMLILIDNSFNSATGEEVTKLDYPTYSRVNYPQLLIPSCKSWCDHLYLAKLV